MSAKAGMARLLYLARARVRLGEGLIKHSIKCGINTDERFAFQGA